jgi:hypothetical protein
MPLSTVLGAQSLVQPAVCTTATRPASPYTGQAIYDTTTASQLIWNGTAWTGTGGLQLVTTATCSSGGTAVGGVVTIGSAVSSVTVTTAFSATYDNYKITVSGGTGSTAMAVLMTLGSTSAGYYWGLQGADFAGSTSANGASNTSSWRVAAANTTTFSTTLDLMSPNLAKNTAFAGSYLLPTASSAGTMGNTGGFLNDSTQYTAFTLTPSTGTLTGGTIRVYGYQNS